MSEVAIRPLATSDAERYHQLRQRALAEHPESFRSSAHEEAPLIDKIAKRLAVDPHAPHDVVLGAFEGDVLVGAIGLQVDPRVKARHRGTVFGMYVARERTGRGIGTQLVESLVERAHACGELDALLLTVTASNARAVRLYEQAGFLTYGCEPGAIRVDGRAYDKLHMIRWLAQDTRAE